MNPRIGRTYGYDDLGNRTSLTYGSGAVQSYAFDPVARLKTLTTDLSGTANDLTIGGSTTPVTYQTSFSTSDRHACYYDHFKINVAAFDNSNPSRKLAK